MLSPTIPANGIFLHNQNITLDPGYAILYGDWTYQLYYSTTDIMQKNYIFYIGNSIGFIPDDTPFGVRTVENTGELELYFRSSLGSVSSPNISIPLNYIITNTFNCYTFVKLGNSFAFYANEEQKYYNNNVLSTSTLPSTIDYFCTCPTNNNIVTANFFRFYNTGLNENYINDYYNYRFPSSNNGLLFNIEGSIDYSNTGIIVESDLTYSSTIITDVCGVI